MPKSKIFLITGVSSGLGRAFAAGALAAGHRVIGTVRRPEDARTFGTSKGTFPLLLDVTNYAAVPEAVREAEWEAGPIDVLVNNAGYGHEGVLEESSMDDLQRQFAANVFGPIAMIKAVLPGMRQRQRGHIVNVTSMGGFVTMPGIAFYCGSKFALEPAVPRRRCARARDAKAGADEARDCGLGCPLPLDQLRALKRPPLHGPRTELTSLQ